MEPFDVGDLLVQQAEEDEPFLEFLRQDSMSLGIYRLPAGGVDTQDPHSEDEAYYIISGKAKIEIADERHSVEEGNLIFVEKQVEHRFFFDIEESLVTLVFFAPARNTLAEA